jgi:hypothetical protein
MEVGTQKIVDEFFGLLVLCSARLVFENHIIIPSVGILANEFQMYHCFGMCHVPSLDVKVLWVEKRVPSRNVELSLLLVFGGFVCFLQ